MPKLPEHPDVLRPEAFATFNPEKIWGSAFGSRARTKICSLPAGNDCISDTAPASRDARPAAVDTVTGKNAISAETAIFEDAPKPSHVMRSGAIAMIGIACEVMISG